MSSAGATSRSLIARVRSNEPEAWERLVALYAPFVFHHCRRAGLQADDAADVFQEVFQAAWTKITSFEKARPGDTFRGWLTVIARNKIHDLRRDRGRQPAGVGGSEAARRLDAVGAAAETAGPGGPIDPGNPGDPADLGDRAAELRLLRAALDAVRGRFRERTWRAFTLTALDGRTPADAAEELGLSPGAVRVAKCRVLRELRAELGDV